MRRLHPATILIALLPQLKAVLTASWPLLIGAFATGGGDRLELTLAALGLLGGLTAVTTYFTTRFGVDGERLVWKSGWLWKRDREIPLDKIQNVNLQQSFLERLLKVATLQVETAAGDEPELNLRSLSLGDAESFRNELLSALPSSAPVDLSSSESEPDYLYRLDRDSLALGGLSENHLAAMIVAIIPLLGAPQLLIRRVEEISRKLPVLPRSVWIVLGILVLLVAITLGWIWGTISYIVKYAGFRVSREGSVLKIAYGWLSKTQLSVRTERIELVTQNRSLIQKRLGRCSLTVGTAGSFGEAGTVAPLALMCPDQEANQILVQTLKVPVFDDLPYERFPQILLRVSFVTMLIGLTFSLGILIGMARLSGLVPQFLLFLPAALTVSCLISFLAELLSWPSTGYAITEEGIACRQGFFVQSTSFMPWDRVEVVKARQSPFWRRKNAWQVAIIGMTKSLAIPAIPQEALLKLQARLRSDAQARQASMRSEVSGITDNPTANPG